MANEPKRRLPVASRGDQDQMEILFRTGVEEHLFEERNAPGEEPIANDDQTAVVLFLVLADQGLTFVACSVTSLVQRTPTGAGFAGHEGIRAEDVGGGRPLAHPRGPCGPDPGPVWRSQSAHANPDRTRLVGTLQAVPRNSGTSWSRDPTRSQLVVSSYGTSVLSRI